MSIEGIPVYDIECINWTIPVAVGLYDGCNYIEFLKESDEDDVIWRFLTFLKENRPGIKLYAHCGSRFDGKFILDSLCKHDQRVALEAGFLRLRWTEPNICFEDSYLLLPMSLKKASQLFEVEAKETWDYDSKLKPWELGDKLQTFRSYLKTDCLALSHSLGGLCEVLGTNFGQMPSLSLSTTAAKVFDKCFYSVRDIQSNEEYEPFIRRATYGGRNEVYKRYGERIHHYDVRSMFVSCYNVPVPIGRMRWVKPDIDNGTLVEATVKVPKDWYIGPLPYKRTTPSKLEGRLIFPVGEFTSWWDIREIRHAISLGVDVSIRRQLICEEEPILKAFGDFVGRLRGTKYDALWKLFGLSLSGKFGQSRWRDVIKEAEKLEDPEGWTPLDKDELYFTKKEYVKGEAPYIKPAVAMRVRSEARIRHLDTIRDAMRIGGEVFYGDTDSIFTTSILPNGPKVGDLVYIEDIPRGYFIKQKLYGLHTKTGFKQTSAGYSDLKLTEKDFKNLLEGASIEVTDGKMPSYRNVLLKREVELLERTRTIRSFLESDSRLVEGMDTRPICLP